MHAPVVPGLSYAGIVRAGIPVLYPLSFPRRDTEADCSISHLAYSRLAKKLGCSGPYCGVAEGEGNQRREYEMDKIRMSSSGPQIFTNIARFRAKDTT